MAAYLYDKVYQLVFVHLLSVEVGDQETDVITLATNTHIKHHTERGEGERETSMGFLLRMKKCSALCIMNLMNFLHRIFSISSA